MVTSQAQPTPITKVPAPTPTNSHSVLNTYRGNTVAARCAHMSPAGTNTCARITTIGAARIAATAMAINDHPSKRSPPRPIAEASRSFNAV